jgi:hypothetical protein
MTVESPNAAKSPLRWEDVYNESNYRGEEKVFTADRQSIAPAQTGPSARERQVLSYHKRHHSTSPLYERIRAKYPDW